METLNRTPFPALAMENVDQHGRKYHVLVLRQTLSFASGMLDYADEQTPLCECDSHFDHPDSSSVRQESDLCAYKPKCDIIVNATAHAPAGKPSRRVGVRLLVVGGAGSPQSPADKSGKVGTPTSLIDKVLWVVGECQFRKKSLPVRAGLWLIKCATLTLLRPSPWKLSRPKPFTSLPIRYEFAYGGQCRIDDGDRAAARVPPRQRLVLAANGAGQGAIAMPQPIAHTSFAPNPVGAGFAQAWLVRAASLKAVSAPRIAREDNRVTARQFSRWLKAPDAIAQSGQDRALLCTVAGFGIRPKTDPERSRLIGTVDASFVHSEKPLPSDFDPAYWNAAPPDQQVPHLSGDETITLVNLCARGTPCSGLNSTGDTVLPLTLPRHECFVRIEMESGESISPPMKLDTVIVEPEERQLILVWRLTINKLGDMPIRSCELRMWTHAARDAQSASDKAEAAIAAARAAGGKRQ